MAFTTPVFIYVFLPLCVLLYAAARALQNVRFFSRVPLLARLDDLFLIALSLFFYAWAAPQFAPFLVGYIAVLTGAGKIIQRQKEAPPANAPGKRAAQAGATAFAVLSFLLVLLLFKYAPLTARAAAKIGLPLPPLVMPLALSFITFHAVSYLVDISRGDAKAGSLIDCALYISFFPKMISGPIVLWKDFASQIARRDHSQDNLMRGVNGIMLGFSKKLLLADAFGQTLRQIQIGQVSQGTAIATFFLYFFQIYFDFSGYSDIAVGLARLFGFSFKENFRFPYLSASLGEFWRRWHISLGAWFRAYVYIPLGGSRGRLPLTLRNLFIVFLFTGIWHGSTPNFIVWGVLNGLIVMTEKLLKPTRVCQKTPIFVKRALTLMTVLLLWTVFRVAAWAELALLVKSALGLVRAAGVTRTFFDFIDLKMQALLMAALLFSTVPGTARAQRLKQVFTARPFGFAVWQLLIFALFILSLAAMAASDYNPFLYFQF